MDDVFRAVVAEVKLLQILFRAGVVGAAESVEAVELVEGGYYGESRREGGVVYVS